MAEYARRPEVASMASSRRWQCGRLHAEATKVRNRRLFSYEETRMALIWRPISLPTSPPSSCVPFLLTAGCGPARRVVSKGRLKASSYSHRLRVAHALRAACMALAAERAIWASAFCARILFKLCDGFGANLDVFATSKTARARHVVVILNLATLRAVENKIALRCAATAIENISIWMVTKPSEVGFISAIKNFKFFHFMPPFISNPINRIGLTDPPPTSLNE